MAHVRSDAVPPRASGAASCSPEAVVERPARGLAATALASLSQAILAQLLQPPRGGRQA